MHKIKARYAVLLGIMLLVAGFVFEAVFNGMPYQDPTPEMTAQWQSNEMVARYFYLAGLVILVAGVTMIILRKVFRAPG